MEQERREFLKNLGTLAGTAVIAPIAVSCTQKPAQPTTPTSPRVAKSAQVDASGAPSIPLVQPGNWDPIEFNRSRGLQGAIPESYFADINGPDGKLKHLGKHLPYVPDTPMDLYAKGHIPIMWGDPGKGYAQHPNAQKGSPNYPRGHWYNWVRVRKAVATEAEEVESAFASWPGIDSDTTVFSVLGGGSMTDNSGKNTIYIVAIPNDVAPGDTIRIHAHCLYHGEYVDFLTL